MKRWHQCFPALNCFAGIPYFSFFAMLRAFSLTSNGRTARPSFRFSMIIGGDGFQVLTMQLCYHGLLFSSEAPSPTFPCSCAIVEQCFQIFQTLFQQYNFHAVQPNWWSSRYLTVSLWCFVLASFVAMLTFWLLEMGVIVLLISCSVKYVY